MAKLIPSGVIQLPNFSELQYNLNRQKAADELAVAKDLAQYKQREGIIAPGAMPLVQSEFDNWQKDAERYAADPSATNFTALNRSYDQYARAHGTAKYLFDTVKERDAKFYADPTKWGIASDQYASDSDSLVRNKYNSFDELMTAASNISELSPRKTVDFSTAEQWVSTITPAWEKTYTNLDVKGTGSVTEQQRDEWFNQSWDGQINMNDDTRKNIILGEVQRQARFGLDRDGQPVQLTQDQINSVLSNPELSAKYLTDAYNRSKSLFDSQARLKYVTPYDRAQDITDINLKRAQIFASRQGDAFAATPEIYVTGESQGMVALPAPVKIGDKQIYQYGVDAAGNKFIYESAKNELGQEVQRIVKASDQDFASAEALINKEFKDPSFFNRNLAIARLRVPKPQAGEMSTMAAETPMASARELQVQFQSDKGLIGQMVGGIRRSPSQSITVVNELANKYPEAFQRANIDINNLTVTDVDRFAEEIAADQSGLVTKAKGTEKATKVAKQQAQETEEYDKLSSLAFEVGSAMGIKQLPNETSDKYFDRIRKKASEVVGDTYRSQGVYKSKSGNEENARIRRIIEFRAPYQDALRAYRDYLGALEDLESAKR